jgi:hypothetical protein
MSQLCWHKILKKERCFARIEYFCRRKQQETKQLETKQTYEDCEVNEEHTPESVHAPVTVGSGTTR